MLIAQIDSKKTYASFYPRYCFLVTQYACFNITQTMISQILMRKKIWRICIKPLTLTLAQETKYYFFRLPTIEDT